MRWVDLPLLVVGCLYHIHIIGNRKQYLHLGGEVGGFSIASDVNRSFFLSTYAMPNIPILRTMK